MDSKQEPNAAQSAPLGPSEVRIAAVDAHGIVPVDASTETEGALALDVNALPAPVTREQRRSRRKRAIRARTISVKRMTKRELELGRMLYPEVEDDRAPAHPGRLRGR